MKPALLIPILTIILLIRFIYIYHHAKTYVDKQPIKFTTLLLSDIDNYSNKPSFTTVIPDSFPPQRVTIIFPAGTTVHYGQTISISGSISQKVLQNNNPILSIYFPKINTITSPIDTFLYPLYIVRQKILHNYQLTLSDIDSSLLLGIVFGIKGNMPKTFSQNLQATGVTHVIAASGMNVTMVAGFLIGFFGKIFKRKTAVFVSIVFLFIYAVFAGLQPSILRATIMGIAVFSGQLFGRQYHSVYILFLTGFVMLFLSPQLIFDIGFQLSFLSTLGIMTIQPLLQKINILTEDLTTTIAAQIATVPILVANFGQYSLVSILVNGLVLWTIPPLMIIGGIGSLIGLCIPFFGRILLLTAIPFLWFFETIISFFASLPIVTRISNQSYLLTVGYYLIAMAVLLTRHIKNRN